MTTIIISKHAANINAKFISLDINQEKIKELKTTYGDSISGVEFIIGDSIGGLAGIAAGQPIDFLYLDSAASAMHTFREFMACEASFAPGACLLIDNAALPEEDSVLSPVRKGKIIVPYLLASPYWEVRAHPLAGDSMVSAILHSEPDSADPDYEHPEYIDDWREHFRKNID